MIALPDVVTRRWTRAEYERLIDLGVFRPGERLELLAGVMVVREPQGSGHAMAVQLVQEALLRTFGPGWAVRAQLPIALDDESEPEPDVAVVRGHARDYPDGHPAEPVLVVEVADSTLRLDRRAKLPLYARARVPEYWIVNLVDRVLEVHRAPTGPVEAPAEPRYGERVVIAHEGVVRPLAAPAAEITVADLLP